MRVAGAEGLGGLGQRAVALVGERGAALAVRPRQPSTRPGPARGLRRGVAERRPPLLALRGRHGGDRRAGGQTALRHRLPQCADRPVEQRGA